jgi:hypothetical protein
MTEPLASSSAAALERKQLSPGFLLTPFGWAALPLALVVSAYPSLLVDLFGVTRERMHLIALALAHVEPPSSFETASLLIRGSTREVLQRVLGRWPVGIKRALKHLPPQVLQRQNYHRLVDLLDDADSAKVLHHAAKIDDLALQVLAELPPSLRRPLPLVLADWPRKLNGFAATLEFLVARGLNRSFDDLVAQLATVTARPQLRAMMRGWVETLPLPETVPPAWIGNARRLDTGEEIRSLGRTWRNCLGSYTEDIDAGSCAVYLWDDADSSAACLARRHGRLGWFLDEVKGPRNADLDPDQVEVIAAAFACVGVPKNSVASPIENIMWRC